MANKLYEESSIRDIAAAIREKNGSSNTYTVAQMGKAVREITTEDLIRHADIPGYVKTEVRAILKKVESVRTDDSIVFLAMSDSHYYGAQADAVSTPDADGVQGTTGNLHGAMAAKILAYAMPFDFMAHMGDVAFGHSTTTSILLQGQHKDLGELIDEAFKGIPEFLAIGNHDTGIYYHEEMVETGETGVYTETGEYLYNTFTALSASDDTVFGDSANGGYCYRDFTDKKLRVFLLNTSEKLVNAQKDQGTYGAQRVWFANALLDLNSKDDAAEWSFLVLSHYPADYGATIPLSELLKAYVEGTSFTISDPVSSYFAGDGTSQTVDFTGHNAAKFIAQFHGHVHNFKASKLYSYATGSGVQYDAWRVCIPNGQYNRENYYTTVGSYTDIDFSETASYPKTVNSADDTSFVVNVVNPSEEKIYSFCYGAGIDRVIGYGETVYYGVSTNLTNASISNSAISIEDGAAYSADVTANDGYELTSVTVTMGGEDITPECVTDGKIRIGEVTGNVVISAVALAVTDYTNQIPISTDASGTVYNGVGYKADTYLSSGLEGSRTGICTTGFIPCAYGDIIRFKNCQIQSGQNNHRFAFYDSTKTMIANMQFNTTNLAASSYFDEVYGDDGNMTQLTVNHNQLSGVAYMRFCCGYIGEDSVVTINEVIE